MKLNKKELQIILGSIYSCLNNNDYPEIFKEEFERLAERVEKQLGV